VALALATTACGAAPEVAADGAADGAAIEAPSALVPTYDVQDADTEGVGAAPADPETDAEAPTEPGASAATEVTPIDAGAEPATDQRAGDGAPTTASTDAPADTEEPGTGAEGPDGPSTVTSTVDDPRGDTTKTLLGSAPAWADLVAGSVTRVGTGDVTITVELAAPPSSPSRGTTMNVAAFHDLTGDGHVDLEIWANWSDAGWYPSWRDNREGRAAFGAETGITVQTRDATLALVVPAERFGAHDRWRWSLGLEWGRYESLGTAAAAHDLAPDEGAVHHGP
jgi:hypothetical protein